MFTKVTTLTEFILEEERNFHNTTGSLTLLLTHIENAAKIIASHVRRSGLVDIMGKTGTTNTYGEEVQKLDQYSNDLLVDILTQSKLVKAIASEELEEPLYLDNDGHYSIFFDPLDGSSNIDSNINIGTIFSIYRSNDSILQPGNKQVAAGYILYGSSVMFVYTSGKGVNGFTLDPSIGSFLLSHPQMKVPGSSRIYSINEGYTKIYDKQLNKYLVHLKEQEKSPRSRYVGSLVADIHRTIIKGGIFLYPENAKDTDGKLRLMFEGNPMAFIISQAGGSIYSKKSKTGNPLDIVPQTVHERAPLVLGSKKNVEEFITFMQKEKN